MKLIIFFSVVIILGIFALFFFQSRLLFYPTSLDKNYVFKFDVPFEEKFISYGDQEIIHGLLFKPAYPTGRILYFHGNGGALDSWGYAAAELAQKLNHEVLILDYPGYGKSSGNLPTSEKALYESGAAALKELVASTDSTLPIILYGRSLGTAVASYLASKNVVQGLILETPYLSIKAMAAGMLPLIPSFLVRYDMDNQKNILNLTIPLLVIHGTTDAVIPYSHAERLVKESPKSNLITIDGGGHNDLSNFPQYWESIEKFINVLKTKSQVDLNK